MDLRYYDLLIYLQHSGLFFMGLSLLHSSFEPCLWLADCLTLSGRRKLSWVSLNCQTQCREEEVFLAERKNSVCEAFRDFWTHNNQAFRDFLTQSSQAFRDIWAQSSLVESAMNCRFEVRSKTLTDRNSQGNFSEIQVWLLYCSFRLSAEPLPYMYYFILLH